MAIAVYSILAILLIAIDQATKYWAVAALSQGPIPLIHEVLEFRYTENRGVAFSMLSDQPWIFIPISLVMTLLMLVILLRSPMRKSKVFTTSLVLVLSGAIGNLIDRILLGFVIDFIYVRLIDFPVFNFADCCVVIGALLLFCFCLFGMKQWDDLPTRTLLFGIKKRSKETDHG